MHARWSRLREPDKALAYLRQAVVNRSRSALRHRAVVERHAARRTTPLVDIETRGLEPGRYTFTVRTPDPIGSPSLVLFTDTRTINVR